MTPAEATTLLSYQAAGIMVLLCGASVMAVGYLLSVQEWLPPHGRVAAIVLTWSVAAQQFYSSTLYFSNDADPSRLGIEQTIIRACIIGSAILLCHGLRRTIDRHAR